jgi:hypothetical protein
LSQLLSVVGIDSKIAESGCAIVLDIDIGRGK